MTESQRAYVVHFAEALDRAAGLHVDAEDCQDLAPALRALLKAGARAEAGAWETVETLVDYLEQAIANSDGVGLFKENCASIPAALRELLGPEDIETILAQRE